MQITPDISFNINPWVLVVFAFVFSGCWWLIHKKSISKQQAERWVIHLEYFGTLLIGLSVAGSGIRVGNFPVQAQIFNPWPGLIMIAAAYQLKLAIQSNILRSDVALVSTLFTGVSRNFLDRIKIALQKHRRPK